MATAVVIAGLGATAGIASAASPNDIDGCVLGAGGAGGQGGSLPVVASQSGVQVGGDHCTFTAQSPVAFAGAGDFTVTVSHPTIDANGNPTTQTTTYTGSGSAVAAGAPLSSGQTVAVAGDTVEATIDLTNNGGLVAVGVNPCVELTGSICPGP